MRKTRENLCVKFEVSPYVVRNLHPFKGLFHIVVNVLKKQTEFDLIGNGKLALKDELA